MILSEQLFNPLSCRWVNFHFLRAGTKRAQSASNTFLMWFMSEAYEDIALLRYPRHICTESSCLAQSRARSVTWRSKLHWNNLWRSIYQARYTSMSRQAEGVVRCMMNLQQIDQRTDANLPGASAWPWNIKLLSWHLTHTFCQRA